jgi:restriction endonuclease
MTTAYTHTIFPGYVPDGFFENDNIEFIRQKVADVLKLQYHQAVNIDKASIVRIMQRILERRLETIPMMNQRVIMECTNEFRNYQAQLEKHMKWEEHYIESQRLYDPTVERRSYSSIKLSNRLGDPNVGGTMRFVFF